MNKYTVSIIFDASKSVVVEADNPAEATEVAYDEAGSVTLCHHCAGNIEVNDAVRALVYDDSDNLAYDDGYDSGVIDDLKKKNEELRRVLEAKWVKFSDEQPEDGSNVRIYDVNCTHGATYDMQVCEYSINRILSGDNGGAYSGITHWMPLPEPPEND